MHCSEKYFIAICLTLKHNIPSLMVTNGVKQGVFLSPYLFLIVY